MQAVKDNVANPIQTTMPERERIPMSLPLLKLAVPDIPGYHLHWMRGDAARIAQATRAGYEFVDADEVNVTNTGLADDASQSGNSDLGSRVSVLGGSTPDQQGQPERLYLMKIRQEWWEKDQAALGDKQEAMANTLRGGAPGENAYIPQANKASVQNMFHKRH